MLRPRRTPAEFVARLNGPVIPYLAGGIVPPPGDLAGAGVVFVGGGELAELPATLDRLSRPPLARLPVLLHVDLVDGLAGDEAGLRYVAALPRVDGIVTVRQHLVGPARKLGLASVLRLFLQDGRAVERGLGVINRSAPDAVELLPGVAFVEVADRFRGLRVPCIAGGLIRTADAVRRTLAAGCRAVSTSDPALWALNRAPARGEHEDGG